MLRPFRGLRYRAGLDLSSVTAPPYDVLDRAAAESLRAASPYNIVRLVLPQGDASASRGERARETMDRWRLDGVLVPDETPGLYVYEQRRAADDTVLLRGLIGVIELRDPTAGVVLPHEDVMPGPVEDRAALQMALQAHLEPIWLVIDGGGAATDALDAAAETKALQDTTTIDGVRHRLWAITDPDQLVQIQAALRGREALIADGHHRYAAYCRVQEQCRTQNRGDGPWDAGLALMVDLSAHGPDVAAIHRGVHGVSLDQVEKSLVFGTRMDRIEPEDADIDALEAGTFLLADPVGDFAVLHLPSGRDRELAFEASPRLDASARWLQLDTAFLHEVLVPRWGVSEPDISYHHDPAGAIAWARSEQALAVLLAPVDVSDVLVLAAQGERMPRKSTSFGPKPRSGFVMRAFVDD